MGLKALLTLSLSCLVGIAGTAYSDDKEDIRKGNKNEVLTGAYQCPGDFSGAFFHEIIFTSTVGDLRTDTIFGNLDTGDCTPRGNDARNLAEGLGCTVGPLTLFQPGGGIGGKFGFVCKGRKSRIINIIDLLSKEILRPT